MTDGQSEAAEYQIVKRKPVDPISNVDQLRREVDRLKHENKSLRRLLEFYECQTLLRINHGSL